MEDKNKKERRIDPLFDGHLEKKISDMSPKEKIEYLAMQSELRYLLQTKVRKIPKKGKMHWGVKN